MVCSVRAMYCVWCVVYILLTVCVIYVSCAACFVFGVCHVLCIAYVMQNILCVQSSLLSTYQSLSCTLTSLPLGVIIPLGTARGVGFKIWGAS